MSPLCESYVPAERLGAMEPFYPLITIKFPHLARLVAGNQFERSTTSTPPISRL
jgi:hypothetical protein